MMILILSYAVKPHVLSGEPSAEPSIKKHPTFHQRVEGFSLSLTSAEMEYLLNDLPFTSELLRRYKLHTLRVYRIGEGLFYAEDNQGMSGTFRLFMKRPGYREYAGGGVIYSRVAGEVRAGVIASVQYHDSGLQSIENDIEFWVLVDNKLLHFFCKIFTPILHTIFKKKIRVFINVVQDFAEKIRANPDILPDR